MRILHVLVLSLFFVIQFAAPMAEGADSSAPAPSWTLQDFTGSEIQFPADDDRASILLFWATWCPYCKALMPHLQSIVDEYGTEKVHIYAINIREDGNPQKFLDEAGYDFQLLLEGDQVAKAQGIYATPGLLVVDRDNRIVFDLYELTAKTRNSPEWESFSHRQRASRRGPHWAAHIRRAIDQTLE